MNPFELLSRIFQFLPQTPARRYALFFGLMIGLGALYTITVPVLNLLLTTALITASIGIVSLYFLERSICGAHSFLGDLSSTVSEIDNTSESFFTFIPRKASAFIQDRLAFLKELSRGKIDLHGFHSQGLLRVFEVGDRLLSSAIYIGCLLMASSIIATALGLLAGQIITTFMLGFVSLYLIECAYSDRAEKDSDDLKSMLKAELNPITALGNIFKRSFDFAFKLFAQIEKEVDFGVQNPEQNSSQKSPSRDDKKASKKKSPALSTASQTLQLSTGQDKNSKSPSHKNS